MPGKARTRFAVKHHAHRAIASEVAFAYASQLASKFQAASRQAADLVFSVTFPADCAICGNEVQEARGLGVCAACWSSLAPWSGPVCNRCGLPFFTAPHGDLCAVCSRSGYAFDFARAFGLYDGALASVIQLLKYRRRERFARKLGEALADAWARTPEFSELADPMLVPVPLHSTRLRERGFNQAALLARRLARALHRTAPLTRAVVGVRALEKTRATRPQAGLSLAERRENVRGAFRSSRPEEFREKNIVLIDDVMTTGATLSACAEAAREAGAKRVVALVVARAHPDLSRAPRMDPNAVLSHGSENNHAEDDNNFQVAAEDGPITVDDWILE